MAARILARAAKEHGVATGHGEPVAIGSRPLHIAVGAGHHNATPGNPLEVALTGAACRAVVEVARLCTGFAVRCYTPDEGLGMHPGPVDAAPREVAVEWDPVWCVDIFHEIHVQAVPEVPAVRGVFVVYPEANERRIDGDTIDDVDRDVQLAGLAMSQRIAAATGLPVGGPDGRGVMSERQTLIGRQGRRLRIFAATATPAMRSHACRFITEIGCHTNPGDAMVLSRPDFPRRAARGILLAYAALAVSRLGWTFPFRITDSALADRAHPAVHPPAD